MIIRFNGANSGIKEYLETGQTKERFYDRNELDERFIITGNLEITDNIIKAIDNDGQNYYHITLAFKEDSIPNSTLQDITKEFKDFFLNAYNDDEIDFYAEAHLPKLKSYHDRNAGLVVERKPHIHIVIPQFNLLNETKFGFPYDKYQDYVNSFQEYINAKYGLASPKENRRDGFNKHSEMISRYKGDNFSGPNNELKKDLLDKLLECKIESQDAFIDLLKQDYSVKFRNENKLDKSSYINIKNSEMVRGINLKEYVFSKEFLDLSITEKLNYIDAKFDETVKYIEIGLSKPVRMDYLLKLDEWNNYTSYAEKYINIGGSKKDRETYKNLSNEGKLEFLKQKQTHFYNKLNERIQDAGRTIEADRREHSEYLRGIIEYTKSLKSDGRSLSEASGQIDTIGQYIKSKIITRRERDIEQHLELEERGVPSDTRQTEYSDRGNRHEVKNDIFQQIVEEYNDSIKSKSTFFQVQNDTKFLAADILLELVARTHGVIPEKYFITKGYDGTDRIKCGNNNYTPADFLTKELHLKYSEAIPLLQTALQMQKEVYIEMGYDPQKKPYLFHEYKAWLVQYKTQKEKAYNQYKTDVKDKRLTLREDYKAKIKSVRQDPKLMFYAKEKAIRELKSALVKELSALNIAVGHDWSNLRSQYNLEMQNSYRTFLAEKALEGDNLSIQELRRLRVDFEQYKQLGQIRHVDRYEEYRLQFDYKVDKLTGDIVYTINGKDVLRDVGGRIDLLQSNNDSLSVALNLAIQKFGTNLQLFGSDEFKKDVIKYALNNGYKVNYIDDFSQNYLQQLNQELAEEGKYKQAYYKNKWMMEDNYKSNLDSAIASVEAKLKLSAGVDKFLDSAVGEVVDFGFGDINKSTTGDKVYYITIKTPSGQLKTMWSNNLRRLDVKVGESVYLAKTKQEKVQLNVSLHHKVERFVNETDIKLNISNRDTSLLNQIKQNSELNKHKNVIDKLIDGKIEEISKHEFQALILNETFTQLARNDSEIVTVTKNQYAVEKVNIEEIRANVEVEYKLHCQNIVNEAAVKQNGNTGLSENTQLNNVVIINYEEAFINNGNNIPHLTYKLMLKDINNNSLHAVYSDSLPRLKDQYKFGVGDLVNLTVVEPNDLNKINETFLKFEMQQKAWMDKLEYSLKNIKIANIDDGKVSIVPPYKKFIDLDAVRSTIQNNTATYHFSANDKVSLKPVLNRVTGELSFEVSNVIYNQPKQELFKNVFNTYLENAKTEFTAKTGYTIYSKYINHAGIVTNIDPSNNSVTLLQPYVGDNNRTVHKKLNFSEEQFNKISPRLSKGKLAYIGRIYDVSEVNAEAAIIKKEWGVKTIKADKDSKAIDIMRQVIEIKKDLVSEYNTSIYALNTIENPKVGRVLDIKHNPALGEYYIQLQTLKEDKSYYFKMEQDSASKYIKSGDLSVGNVIYTTPVKEVQSPVVKIQKDYDCIVNENDLYLETTRLYEMELSKQMERVKSL